MTSNASISINVDLFATRQHGIQSLQFAFDGCTAADQTELGFAEQIGPAKVIDVAASQIVIAARPCRRAVTIDEQLAA